MKLQNIRLKDTGERVIVHKNSKGDLNYLRHMAAFAFAKKFSEGKFVLDDGSGSGYGSYYLITHGAKRVIGIDISKEAVEYSRNKYNHKNLDFKVMDAVSLSFDDNTFDIVCSFQVIEHINDYKRFISEIKRVLRPGGIALISTPNKKTYSPNTKKPTNPFHVREFYLDEFRKLLTTYFNKVEIVGVTEGLKLKRVFERSFSRRFAKLYKKFHLSFFLKIIPKQLKELYFKWYYKNMSISDFEITKANSETTLDFIGICKKL